MNEHTFEIEATGLPSPRLEDLSDLLEDLVARPHVAGPALAGKLGTGDISLVVTIVDVPEQSHAAALAAQVFAEALVATGRAGAVARVERALAVA